VLCGRVSGGEATNISITSTGEVFNGVYVADGTYTLNNPHIDLTGNGRSDFVGYGAAIVANGTGSRLIVNHANISNKGVVRTGIVADNGANVVVKNSSITTLDGTLPAGYTSTVDLEYMEDAPWMLGISGDVRATNLLGDGGTKAAYVDSSITSQNWGALSTDSGSDVELTAIDSHVANLGDGYGSYVIGNATEHFLGDEIDPGSYAAIFTGGTADYGPSTPSAVATQNTAAGIGLSAAERAALAVRPTVINSRRFGFMWHQSNLSTVNIAGGTVVNSQEATFLDKSAPAVINVSGSALNPRNGIVLQLMEDDDPGPVVVDGKLVNEGVYTVPTGVPAKDGSFSTTTAHSGADTFATFTDENLRGDFYNGTRGGTTGDDGKNMVLTFDHSRVTGVISATLADHHVATISSANYQQLGEVTNTPEAVINNGVLVTVADGSTWTVTGTSYLSSLTVGADGTVAAPAGRTVSMTVDGVATPIVPGHTYTGDIVLSTG
jgi:hypothetical protein